MRCLIPPVARFILTAAAVLVFAADTKANGDPPVTHSIKGSSDTLRVNAESYTRDMKYFSLSASQRTQTTTRVINNMIGVGIEEDNTRFIPGNFSVTVTLQITKYDSTDAVIETISKPFTINYDTAGGARYKKLDYYSFTGAYSVRAKIISIDSGSINWPVSKVLEIRNEMIAQRDYPFSCTTGVNNLSLQHDVQNDELSASWGIDPNPGQTEYDLEWAWVDEGAADNYKNSSGQFDPDLLFTNNATRVTTVNANYNIPLLYDDTGRIFIRVRQVQVKSDGQRVEGVWTWQNASQPVSYAYLGHEEQLNWQATTSFAEEGKRKSVVQYYDGSLRGRQTVTRDNTSNTTVVAESFYDYQGRAVIQVLPSPTLNTAIAYAQNFNKAVNFDGYPKWVYDKQDPAANLCSSPAKPFETSTGTAKYYSGNNPLKTTGSNQFIPDATAGNTNEGYPFTETRLGPDGRVVAQSGVGFDHQIGSNHETKYYYQTPTQDELDELFGTDVGIASHYGKNIVRDANGQYSISYVDMHGRTIATCLAGDAPANNGTYLLEPLPSLASGQVTRQLIDEETNVVVGKSIISTKPIVVTKSGSYQFKYDLSPQQLSILNCQGTSVCYDCIYQLKLALQRDCDGVMIYLDSSKTFTLAQYLTTCTSNGNANGYEYQGFHFEPPSPISLGEGGYTLTKTLTLSSDAQTIYRDIFLANDSCRKFSEFLDKEYSLLIANSNCNINCDSCNAAIGANFNEYKAKFLQESGMSEPLPPGIISQLQSAYTEAKKHCEELCGNNDGQDLFRSLREVMLQDVTPPYGQYAKTDTTSITTNYNIFKDNDPTNSTEFIANNTTKPDYKLPIFIDPDQITSGNYYDEYGNVDLTGEPLVNMTPATFTDAFKTSWAEELLPHHPEFKKLQLSQNQLKQTYQFEADLTKDTTWAQTPISIPNHITDLINQDPFFSGNGAPGAGTYKTTMQNRLQQFYEKQTSPSCTSPTQIHTGTYFSAWQVALSAVFCRDKQEPADPCTLTTPPDPATIGGCLELEPVQPPATHPVIGCETDWDWAWKVYKSIYLAERGKLISKWLNDHSPSMTGVTSLGYHLRFVDKEHPDDILDNLGFNGTAGIRNILNLVSTDPNGAKLYAQQQVIAQYDKTCRGYAQTWITQLQSCPQVGTLSQADSTWLVDRLLQVCKTGADEGHMLGSSSVKPGDPPVTIGGHQYYEFPDVVKEFLSSKLSPGINEPYTAECFPWMITVPAPYDKQPAINNSYVLTKPSVCECERLTNLKTEFQNSSFNGTFSYYLYYKHGTIISQENLDILTSLCNNTYTCKMLPAPILLPPALQCRGTSQPPKTCISCDEYAAIKTEFYTHFGQHAPVMQPQTQADVTLNHAFADYANYKTGFSKKWTDYVAFENACNNANPDISCGSLDSTLQLFYLSPEYLQHPVGISCEQAFENFFNTHYGVQLTFAQWMAKFAACGNVPNVCQQVITCSTFNSMVDDYYNTFGVQVYQNANCQQLFVNFINGQLSTNYSYAQLNAIYQYTCGSCGPLNICGFPNHFLITKVYNDFKAANGGHPWELPDCQGAFALYFNNYFGLNPALSYNEIRSYYNTNAGSHIDCVPNIDQLCNPPYTCNDLNRLLNKFLSIYSPVSQLPNCQATFAQFFNINMGTNYTYAEIAALYQGICGSPLTVCSNTLNCTNMIVLVDSFVVIHPPFGISGPACQNLFIQYFNAAFGTNYNSFDSLRQLYRNCNFELNICDGCSSQLVTTPAALDEFLLSFKEKYPDPASQLEGDCESVFTASFNSEFQVSFTYEQIQAYYWAQRQLLINPCASQCTRITAFINNFNSQYAALKLPQAAREDLFTFLYNKEFVGNSREPSAESTFSTDPYAFNPTVNFESILSAISHCGIENFSLAPVVTISPYDPQVLLSLKDVYYIIHPNGLPNNCESDFASWFNTVMQSQFEYSDLFDWYNNICGNNAGYICSAAPDSSGSGHGGNSFAIHNGNGPNLMPNNLPPMLCGLNQPAGGPIYYNDDPCKDLYKIALHTAIEKYELYLDSLRNVFDTAYHNKCMAAKSLESLTMTYVSSEYHYTLYYYDQAGNLVKTVPPAGVNKLGSGQVGQVQQYRKMVQLGYSESNYILQAPHSLVTEYRYNTLNQVTWQHTPDGGTSQFFYDRLGRLVVSQNAKQAVASGGQVHYSYTLYDELGRITEVGQKPQQAYSMDDDKSRDPAQLTSWLSAGGTKEQITRTVYDVPAPFFDPNSNQNVIWQRNLRNRVSYTYVKNADVYDANYPWNAATIYSYDIHGNVDTLLQDYGSSASSLSVNVMNSTGSGASGSRWKKIVYDFDLISGKVNAVTYQPDYYDAASQTWIKPADQFNHRYTYDAENRLITVETSHDKMVWETDARYSYYKHGPLARTELGDQQVQGLDYVYTLQGWLKGVNSTSVGDGSYDAGQDGKTGSVHANVARDAYGFSLNYFSGDYKPVGGTAVNPFITNSFNLTNTDNHVIAGSLYNGNIAAMLVNIPKLGDAQLYGYKYDQLNRIISMDAFTGLTNSSNSFTAAPSSNYRERVSYDANGNILNYYRHGNAARVQMDSLTYYYKNGTNQLDKVTDAAPDATTAQYPNYNDLKQGQQNGNYQYDEIGNLVSDNKEGINAITWTVYGKISQVEKAATTIYYTYDAAGNRISKAVKDNSTQVTVTTWYVRDASGNVMSTYTKDNAVNNGHLTQSEIHLYGSSRLGVLNVKTDIQNQPAPGGNTTFERGDKFFELSNHLGNVLVTISDKRIAHTSNGTNIDYYTAEVVTANDYYPFGMIMPGRKYQARSESYRFSINGQEKDIELNENFTSALYWEYDSRIGRRWNMDPKAGISVSAFVCFMDNPIFNIDIRGDSALPNPQTGQITARFIFVRGAGVSNAQFAQYQRYFQQRVTQTYNTSTSVNTGATSVPVSSNFTYATATAVPAQIPLGDNYIVVNPDNQQRSSVNDARNVAQMNVNDMNINNGQNNRASHEVGHLFGLSDRYHYIGNMIAIPGNPTTLPGTQTIPMNLPPGTDPNYNLASNNLMSVGGNQITPMQWQTIFSGVAEQRYPIATFYVQLGNSGIRQQAAINNAVFLGMNLYRIQDVLNNTYKDRSVMNHMPSFFILNGGTRVLNLRTNIIGSGNMSESLWNNTPNQAIIQQSQQ